jgi:hypothetical protein
MLSVALHVCAAPPTYKGERRMVEDANLKDTTPTSERVYIDAGTEKIIARYKDGLTLRGCINRTKHNGESVVVMVFREADNLTPVFGAEVKPSEKPKFTLEPSDVVVVWTHPIVIN